MTEELPAVEPRIEPVGAPIVKGQKLTTEAELQQYGEMIGEEYQEISPLDHKKIKNKDIYYRVVNVHRQFTGIMEDQYIAKVVVERHKKVMGVNSTWVRQPCPPPDSKSADFQMSADKFCELYRRSEG